MKPPPVPMLAHRHRRLCLVCSRASLPALTGRQKDAKASPTSVPTGETPPLADTSSYDVSRWACSCSDEVFICRPCGQAIRSADMSYRQIWSWRTRYGSQLGGLGTGIGEGIEGVKCARGVACLAAEDIEVEMDCGPDELGLGGWRQAGGGYEELDGFHAGEAANGNGNEVERAGYLTQEVEGIGGTVRMKFRKKMRVGKAVEEYEDEREQGDHLSREKEGDHRSWCGWCDKVIPGDKDRK